MKVLITGGAGFIGSHLAKLLQASGDQVIILDNYRGRENEAAHSIPGNLIIGSVTDPAAVRSAIQGAEVVIHLAALVSVEESMHSPLETNTINVNGLLTVLKQAANAGVRRVVFASSAAVYGDGSTAPLGEDDLPNPRSPYAVSKLAGEQYLRIFGSRHGLETVSLRFFNVFGAGQNASNGYAAVIPAFIGQALTNEPITILGDGSQTRDFIHVSDICGALDFASRTPGLAGVFNAGYGKETRIAELASFIRAAANSVSRLRYEPSRPGDILRSCACTKKLRDAGWLPRGNLWDTLESTVRHHRDLASGRNPAHRLD